MSIPRTSAHDGNRILGNNSYIAAAPATPSPSPLANGLVNVGNIGSSLGAMMSAAAAAAATTTTASFPPIGSVNGLSNIGVGFLSDMNGDIATGIPAWQSNLRACDVSTAALLTTAQRQQSLQWTIDEEKVSGLCWSRYMRACVRACLRVESM